MNNSSLMISATLLDKSALMPGGLQQMSGRSELLLGIILDIGLHGISIYTAELRRPAAMASHGLCVIMFFAIYQNMGPAQWGNTCLQKRKSQS